MRQAIKEQVIVESYQSDNSKQIVLIRALNIGRSQAGIVIQPKETEKGKLAQASTRRIEPDIQIYTEQAFFVLTLLSQSKKQLITAPKPCTICAKTGTCGNSAEFQKDEITIKLEKKFTFFNFEKMIKKSKTQSVYSP